MKMSLLVGHTTMTALMVVLRVVMGNDRVTKRLPKNRWRDMSGIERVLAICPTA
jgi:hypothetical protein